MQITSVCFVCMQQGRSCALHKSRPSRDVGLAYAVKPTRSHSSSSTLDNLTRGLWHSNATQTELVNKKVCFFLRTPFGYIRNMGRKLRSSWSYQAL